MLANICNAKNSAGERLRSALRRVALPPAPPPTGVVYTPVLVTYVALVTLGTVFVVGATVPSELRVADWSTAAVGFLAIFGLTTSAVPWTGLRIRWSSSSYVHLALALILGPLGATVAAAAETAGSALRFGTGLFRSVFNFGNAALTNFAALWTYRVVAGDGHTLWINATAGLVAGAVSLVVNYLVLGIVVRLAGGPRVRTVVRSGLAYVPYHLGYGIAATGSLILYGAVGTYGLVTSLVPVVLLQGFLVVLWRQQDERTRDQVAHQAERSALLQQALDASDDERQRIARDLHDGVIQELVALSFSLSGALRKKSKLGTAEWSEIVDERFDEAGAVARKVVAELRTLIIEIAAPKLENSGLRAALDDLLTHTARTIPRTSLLLDEVPDMTSDQRRLVYRVAQEAVRNAVKYSDAQALVIEGALRNGVLRLAVTDDGRGFSEEERERRQQDGHVGLGLLRGSCKAVGAELTVTSAPGRGTTVAMELPLETEPLQQSA